MMRNKRYIIVIIAVIMAAMTGCAKLERAEVDTQPSEYPIVFESPIVNPATKAGTPFTTNRKVLYGTTYPTNWNFVVSAVLYDNAQTFASVGWSGATDFFSSSLVHYEESNTSNGGWTNGKFWPKEGKLAFQAYSPQVNNASYNGAAITYAGVLFNDYKLATNGDQPDLMYSNRAVDQTKSNFTEGISYDGVQLSFKHALSSIVFSARTTTNLNFTEVKITNITLSNVNTKGTFRQNLTEFETNNTLTNPATWTPSTNPADVTSYDNLISASGVSLSATTTNLWENNNAADLLVMPQDFGNATISVTYTVRTGDGPTVPQTTTVRLADLNYYANVGDETPIAGYNSFEMGKRYLFHIEIGIQKIRFLPYLSPWGGV